MKKILFLIKIPPPIHGGTLVSQMVNGSLLLQDNFNIKTIPIRYVKNVKDLGVISIKKFVITIFNFFKLLRELIYYRPDLVYFHMSHLGKAFIRDLIFVILVKVFRTKLVYHMHGKGIKNVTDRSKVQKYLYKFVFNNTYVICLSELLVDDIENVFNGKVFIVNNGIPVNEYLPQKIVQDNFVNVLFLSNLIVNKGILDFIDSLEIIFKKKIKFNAKIIGAEFEITKENIDSILNKKKLSDSVKYLGPLYVEDKTIELINSDIFVFPTYSDCFPLVILESMQLGLPVVSTFEGAIPGIVDDGKTGFLVEKQNPKLLADKLELLIYDKRLRESLGQKAREKFLRNYTLDIFEQNMKAVFDTILFEK